MLERGRPIFPSRSRSLFFPLPCPICLVFCSTRIFFVDRRSIFSFSLSLIPSSLLSSFFFFPFSPFCLRVCIFFVPVSTSSLVYLFVTPPKLVFSSFCPLPLSLRIPFCSTLFPTVSPFFPSHAIPPSRPLFPRTSPTIPPRFSLDLYVSFLLYSRPSIRSFASFSSSLFRTLVPLPFYLRFTLSLYRLFHPLLRCPGPLFPLSRYNTAVFGAAWSHVSRDFECIGLDTPQLGAPFRTNFMLNADFSLGYIPAR